jgi:cystathionine gamma-synthase
MVRMGGMLSFELASAEHAHAFVTATSLFTLAGSLGSVDSLVNHPATMTHAALEGTPNEISSALIRLSVGIEDVEDLLADLNQALDAAYSR